MVNDAMLRMACVAYPGRVACYASKSALPHLDVSKCKEIHVLPLNASNGKPAVLLRFLCSAIYNIVLLLLSKKNDIIFYNHDNPFSIRAIDTVNRVLKRRVVVCCHGEMEYLSLPTAGMPLYKRVLSKLVRSYFNTANTNPAPGLRFLVLSDVALENLKPYLSEELANRFSAIDHPILPAELKPADAHAREGDILNVGTVGILNRHKGSDDYLKLINLVKKNESEREVDFSIIGHIQCEPEPFERAGVRVPSKPEEPLPETKFLAEVSELDFILFFYSSDTYRLTASGALLDAVRLRKPIIALRNDYFEYFFKKFGSIGYLVDSIEEMAELIKNNATLTRDFDFDAIERRLSPASLQPVFESALKSS